MGRGLILGQGSPHQHRTVAEAELDGHHDLSGAPSGSRSLESTRPPAGTRRDSHAPRRLLHADCGSAQSLANPASQQENRGPAEQAGARPRPLTSKPGRRRVARDPRDHEAWARAQPRRDDCALRPRRDPRADSALRIPQPARSGPPRGATCRSQPADSRKKRARSSSAPVTATNSLKASCRSAAIFAPCTSQTAPADTATARTPGLRSACRSTVSSGWAPGRRLRPMRCYRKSPPCGKPSRFAPSGGRCANHTLKAEVEGRWM